MVNSFNTDTQQKMKRKIIFIHGRNYKPAQKDLERLWIQAIEHGIKRDCKEKLPHFKKIPKELVYYADYSAEILDNSTYYGKTNFNPNENKKSRATTLNQLQNYKKEQFSNVDEYNNIKGRGRLKEPITKGFSAIAYLLNMGKKFSRIRTPDMIAYWEEKNHMGHKVRCRLIEKLVPHLKNGDDILLVAHSHGSIVSYDTLWILSHTSEYRQGKQNISKRKINKWITIGSPLGDPNIKKHLKGAGRSEIEKYPTNISSWVNIAAKDDHIAHDKTIANDFSQMEKLTDIAPLNDRRIYNLALRDQKSYPHHALGYLIHPTFIQELTNWL